jgi:hypothetical protein
MQVAFHGSHNHRKRPPVTGTLIGVRLQQAVLGALDSWRQQQAESRNQPDAIRRLLEFALAKR